MSSPELDCANFGGCCLRAYWKPRVIPELYSRNDNSFVVFVWYAAQGMEGKLGMKRSK
jgi:hypothetical protein